jgi:type II secretory pathway pseudopilin PulG
MKIKNWKLKINPAFTLIDLMVSIAIITLLTSVVVVSFIQAERNQNLANGAEVLANQLRTMENMALVGKTEPQTGKVPPGGYGVQFFLEAGNISYRFFADMNRDLIYDPTISVPAFPTNIDQIIDLRKYYELNKDVMVSQVLINEQVVDLSGRNLNIVFKMANAKVYVDGQTNFNRVLVIFKHNKTDKTKTIKIYPISRQISVE